MILAILQARMTSSRLPGKVLRPIVGKAMLAHQIKRIEPSALIDKLVIATSTDGTDYPIEKLCRDLEIECFRGNLDNVLDRYYRAALKHKPEIVVRLTGDCPLADHRVIDGAIQFFLENDFDYASNSLEPTFPNGLDVEVFSFNALERAWKEAELPSEKEHVTPYIYNHRDKFKVGQYKQETDMGDLRWTVDEPRDFEFVTRVYEELYEGKPEFSTDDILDLLRRKPELLQINSGIIRNEGYLKSLMEDKAFRKDKKDA